MKIEDRRQKAEDRGQKTIIRHPLSVIRPQGFTLVELVVSVGIMAMVILFAGTIFKESIGSYRAASAQAEIMQKLRVITQQLDSDFKGLRKDAPMFIWFQKGINGPDDPNRFDQVMFFADGDFQSSQTYDVETSPSSPYFNRKIPKSTGAPVVGNVARIQYCHARIYSDLKNDYIIPENQTKQNASDRLENIYSRTLARRLHILSADPDIAAWPDANSFANFQATFLPGDNNNFEHDLLSLSQWQMLAGRNTGVLLTYNDVIVSTCFALGITPEARPSLNLEAGGGLHMLMNQGVGSFSIQWPYMPLGSNKLFWWPAIDPNEDGKTDDSDFQLMLRDAFGVYFNAPAGVNNSILWTDSDGAQGQYYPADKPDYPMALKFTFTLYDSRGVFRDGQTFTHIVYLGD